MKDAERKKRLYEPQTSHFEYLDVLAEGAWYRRGPPCPTCQDYTNQGVVLGPEVSEDGWEACSVCTTLIDVKDYGPRETGRVRILYPPEDDGDLGSNPYLNPMRPAKGIKEHEEAMVVAGLHDVGNGRRLAMRFGEQIRYTGGWGWLVYDGRRWRRDDVGTVERMAKAVVEECLALDPAYGFWSRMEDEHGISLKAWRGFLHGCFARGKVDAALAMAKSEPNVVARTEEFDQDTWLLNCKNGVVDLTTGTLRPSDPELYATQLIPHDFPTTPKDMECPRWEAFLEEVCCGDAQLVDFLHRAIGYTLTGDTREQKLFFLYGDGANGKSTFLELLRYIFGDYSTHLSFEALLKSRNQDVEKAFAHLPSKRYATSIEAGEARSWNEEAVKTVTGGDTIRGRILYADTFEFRPVCKIWVAANDRPRIDGVNEGIWRRFFLIPFLADIPPERQDANLLATLKEEAPGILYWAVRGAMRWYQEVAAGRGLKVNPPDCMRAALVDYREESDVMGRWIHDNCILDSSATCSSTDLLKDFNSWAKENHEPELTQTRLGTRLGKWRGGKLTKTRSTGGRIRWQGITTKTHYDREDRGLHGFDRPLPSESRLGDSPGTTSAPF